MIMPTARDIFQQFTDSINSLDTASERCLALFADDAVFEFPYAPALGLPARHEGKENIRALLELIRVRIPPFAVSDVVIHDLKNDSGLFVEYHSVGRIGGTGKVYAQDYATFFVVENGKIKLIREYFNAIASARAILPGGLADVPGN
jgi:uncharacterized protein